MNDETYSQGSDSTVCLSPIIAVRSNGPARSQEYNYSETQNSLLALSQVDMETPMFSDFMRKEQSAVPPTPSKPLAITQHFASNSDHENALDRLQKWSFSTNVSVASIRKHVSFVDLKIICSMLDSKGATVLNKVGLCNMLYDGIVSKGSPQQLIRFLKENQSSCPPQSAQHGNTGRILPQGNQMGHKSSEVETHTGASNQPKRQKVSGIEQSSLALNLIDQKYWKPADEASLRLLNTSPTDRHLQSYRAACEGLYLADMEESLWSLLSPDSDMMEKLNEGDISVAKNAFFSRYKRVFAGMKMPRDPPGEGVESRISQWVSSLLNTTDSEADILDSERVVEKDDTAAIRREPVILASIIPRRGVDKQCQTDPSLTTAWHDVPRTTDGILHLIDRSRTPVQETYKAVKRVQFVDDRIGLLIVKGKKAHREVAQIKGKRKHEMSDPIYNLLCVGDVLVAIDEVSMDRYTFDEQLELLKRTKRPVLLEFASSESF